MQHTLLFTTDQINQLLRKPRGLVVILLFGILWSIWMQYPMAWLFKKSLVTPSLESLFNNTSLTQEEFAGLAKCQLRHCLDLVHWFVCFSYNSSPGIKRPDGRRLTTRHDPLFHSSNKPSLIPTRTLSRSGGHLEYFRHFGCAHYCHLPQELGLTHIYNGELGA